MTPTQPKQKRTSLAEADLSRSFPGLMDGPDRPKSPKVIVQNPSLDYGLGFGVKHTKLES